MSARYLDHQLRETASEGIPRALLLRELSRKSFRIANIKELRMRDTTTETSVLLRARRYARQAAAWS